MVWWTCNSWFRRHAIVGHLASTTVCTSHLINERLRQKSQQYAIFFILIWKPAFLKIFIMSFRIRSVFYLDVFLKSTSPSSLYKPVTFLVYLIIKIVYVCRQAPRFRRYQNCPWWRRCNFLYLSSSNVPYHCTIKISYNVLLYACVFLEC